jgi:hypothetical protein
MKNVHADAFFGGGAVAHTLIYPGRAPSRRLWLCRGLNGPAVLGNRNNAHCSSQKALPEASRLAQ